MIEIVKSDKISIFKGRLQNFIDIVIVLLNAEICRSMSALLKGFNSDYFKELEESLRKDSDSRLILSLQSFRLSTSREV